MPHLLAKLRMTEKFTKTQIGMGLVGMLCPIPLVGEALTAKIIYPILNEDILKDNPGPNIVASLATAGLMRMKLYEPIYFPMMEFAKSYFS